MASASFRGYNDGVQIGFNSGPINLPPGESGTGPGQGRLSNRRFPPYLERPETPTNPLSTVPFPRDLDFVSRDTLLRRIHEKSLVLGSRIALVGLGGVG